MITRKRHPNKEIERAIKYAESQGWRYQKAGNSAHAWGRLLCFFSEREGCSMSIWSTPRDADNHAKQIYRRIMLCPHINIGKVYEKNTKVLSVHLDS